MWAKFRFNLCLFFTSAFIIAGCNVKRPDGVIPPSEMENLLYDYYIAKAMGENLSYSDNYKKALYIDAVFKKYNTTEAVLDSSLVWYTRNTETLSKISENVSKRLKTQQDAINHLIALRDKKPKMSEPGDSINVWPWAKFVRLTGEPNNTYYSFSLPADTNYKDRDTLIWEVRYHMIEPHLSESRTPVTMAMQIIYEKDTLSRLGEVTQSGTRQIRLYADTLGAIKEVKGFIYYPSQGKKDGLLLADNFKLTRYHCSDSLSFAERDSINRIKTVKSDSLKNSSSANRAVASEDSLKVSNGKNENQRMTPDEMNRRRTVTSPKKPEQIKVEQHINDEKAEQRRQRIQNSRRGNQQRR